ncbi:hypothetical protein TrCOL_g9304 [Triparma columacea]|uniref:Uncharacterized protein n=1 Tax=Triparma columacea TaxID=722753 RepID=A0A9W7GHM2_9STRA|nr:hypothetical protein TrCOL_g9304 [Triparma columacea]
MVTVMGLTVCLGWYASLVYEYIFHGRFFDILYDNAAVLFSFDLSEDCGSKCVLGKKILTNIVDFIAHPLPLFFLLRSNRSMDLSKFNSPASTISAFILSRSWSIFHNVFNMGFSGHSYLWYCDRHVYNLVHLEGWTAAYAAETAAFVYLGWDLWRRRNKHDKEEDVEGPRRSKRLMRYNNPAYN